MIRVLARLATFVSIAIFVYAFSLVVLLGKDKESAFKVAGHFSPQYVILSFDGSKSIAMWQETLAFARMARAMGKPVLFTYFISGAYFLTDDTSGSYEPPRHGIGASAIGFSDSVSDIDERVREINSAARDGHEIASHAVGHFDGSRWRDKEWIKEFDQFEEIVFGVADLFAPAVRGLEINVGDIVGFRAPLLGVGKSLYHALPRKNYLYDSSGVGDGKAWPTKKDGIWCIPLSMITLDDGRGVLSMDYNLFHLQTGGNEKLKRFSPEWNIALDQVYRAYLRSFYGNYGSTRAPIVIASHFTDWNEGVYFEAMKKFALEVCGIPDVRCTTMKSLVSYLEQIEVENP